MKLKFATTNISVIFGCKEVMVQLGEHVFCGVDVGARTTKVVLTAAGGRMLASSILDTGSAPERAAAAALECALEGARLSPDQVVCKVATGYGRRLVADADRVVTEISCHGRGVRRLFPDARTVVDIGGQDAKVIRLAEDGSVEDFCMNDRCAAGTGRFLEAMAESLHVALGDLGTLSAHAKGPVQVSSTCVVFAESEVVGLISEGEAPEDVVAGLHAALAERIATMGRRIGISPPVVFAGGVALNQGMVEALRAELRIDILLPEEPQTTGALGAALIGAADFVSARSGQVV